jgi:hypothetical protein
MPRGHFDRSARKAETRARLLHAAAEVYALRGFGGATLDEVAAPIGTLESNPEARALLAGGSQ